MVEDQVWDPKKGVIFSEKETFLQSLTPTGPLANETITTLRALFHVRQLFPSEDVWHALGAVAYVLEAMAEGGAEPAFYVSPLDPGTGKTQVLVQFLKALISSEKHETAAALICVQRKEQITDITAEACLSRQDFAVLTADEQLNALGSSNPETARVLFTTHAQVELRCRHRSFESVEVFHYRGQPRRVRVWDETILPGKPIEVIRDAIAALLVHVRSSEPAFAQSLEQVFDELGTAEDRAVFQVPDLGRDHNLQAGDVLALMNNPVEEQKRVVERLFQLFGRAAVVRRNGAGAPALVSYENSLPGDLTPLLVLDASGRVRGTYKLWAERRGGLVMLPAARKEYQRLTIGVWNRGGGKSSFELNGDVLLNGIASTMNERPHEDWLVIHHKRLKGLDFEADLRKRLNHEPSRVSFLNWGSHDATNRYSHISNVVIAGTWFLRRSTYEALGQLAAAHPPGAGALSDSDYELIYSGEHKHFLLQALCRCKIRRTSSGDDPVRAYVIASERSSILAVLADVFPSANVEAWTPISRGLRGHVKDAVEFIRSNVIASGPVLTFRMVMDAIGVTDQKNFRRSIRRHPDFLAALHEHGLGEVCIEGKVIGFGHVGFPPITQEERDEWGAPDTENEARHPCS